MNRRIDLVARTSGTDSFRKLLNTLESQVSVDDQIGVVASLDGVDDPEARRFVSLAGHRTNLVVADGTGNWWASAVEASSAEFLLPVAEGEVLTPGAVRRLLDATASGADVLVGRAATPGTASNWDLFAAAEAPGAEALREEAGQLPVLVRRSLATTDSGDVPDVRRAAVAAAQSLTLLPDHPVLRRPRPPARTAGEHEAGSVSATGSWSEGALHLEIASDGQSEVRHVTLRHLDSGVDWHLEPQPAPRGLVVAIDPRTAAAGESLGRGRWVVDVHLTSAVVRPVAWQHSPGSALLDGVPVTAARGKHQRVVLDVGATRRSPLDGLSAAEAVIDESARGTHLRWPLPFAQVAGAGSWPAGLELGGFPITARLVSSDGTACLEAWLTGLHSRVPLSMALAGSPAYATGFDLEIGTTGLMALLPSEQQAGPRGGPTETGRKGGWRSLGLVQRLRPGANRSA